jgi:hypothetical protein
MIDQKPWEFLKCGCRDSLLYNGYRVFAGGKGGRGVMLTTHPLLVPRLRKSWAIPPLTLWVLLGLLRGSPLPLPVVEKYGEDQSERSCEKLRSIRIKEERNILQRIKRREANWICHSLRRNCHAKHVIQGTIDGRIEVTGRRGRRRKELMDDLKKNWGYWKLKEEALGRTLWRTRLGRGYVPVKGQTARRTL